MKNYKIYTTGILAVLLSACSVNEDLVMLDEVDDIYYQAEPQGQVMASNSNAADPRTLSNANDAESSYYGSDAYAPSESATTTPQPETIEEEDDGEYVDYFEEDYGRRIQNFHGQGTNDGYYHADPAYNNNPRMNMNFGMGMGSFGRSSAFGFGMSYGNMNPYYGFGGGFYQPFYDPFYDPFFPRFGYNSMYFNRCYDPFFPSFYCRGFGGFGPGFGFGYPGYGYNYFPGSVWGGPIYVGDGTVNNSIQNASRPNSARPGRGGIISPDGEGGRPGIQDQQTGSERGERTESKRGTNRLSDSREDATRRVDSRRVDTRSESRGTYTRAEERRSYTRGEGRTSPRTISPQRAPQERSYQRSRDNSRDYNRSNSYQRPRSTPSYNRSNIAPNTRQRSNSRSTPSFNTRSRSSGGSSISSPSRSRSSSPSISSPSRSRSGGSSPSRSNQSRSRR